MPLRMILLLIVVSFAQSLFADDLRLTLPLTGYGVVGSEIGVDFDNVVLKETTDDLRFEVKSPLGKSGAKRWSVTPTPEQVGDHEWKIAVYRGDEKLAEKSMTWHVSPNKPAADREIKILIVGDSLTNATIYPADLAERLTKSGVKWKMFGGNRPLSAKPEVSHEGYGGWTWERFITLYNPEPWKDGIRNSSPFLFPPADKPQLDIARYFKEECGGETPDYVIFKLGINDCFGANPNELAKTDESIDRVFGFADTLIAAFRKAAPNAELGICLTTPGNALDSAFEDNYKGSYPRWGWKRIQHRIVERQLQKFAGDKPDPKIHVIPTELNLDTLDGYPANNSVHPNEVGYRQIGASIHAWLMSRLDANP